ncbi:efflux transporter outer membrane subunit [Salinisphaera hydrothermalis]|uniref:NodT family RND efflux system outer membrane lipoprotein n=1 Tax=Salinisphaera hydrothermalis (strain C41B8) TaxID=1304275 RepID=A0A084IHY6_SALHC|nr:NodT family RND efflux system outer membrane lipoprotein [Salinisphaera hydrothermalis C41B8]
MRRLRFVTVLPLLAALTGCFNLAPDFHRPKPAIPDQWPDAAPATATHANAIPVRKLGWHQFFVDPRLRRTVQLALNNSQDLRQAALDIEKARAEYHLEGAALFPSIDATGSATIEKSSDESSSTSASSSDDISKSSSLSLGFTSYELDFFGQLRNNKQAAFQSLLSSAATRRSTQISLIAETANDWLTLAADKALLELAAKTLTSQRDYYQKVMGRHRLGLNTGSDVDDARASVASAREDVASYTATVAQDRNALNLVAGTTIPKADLPADVLPDNAVLTTLPSGVPSRVLRNRPDVLAVEHTLKADNADIGAARAAFFPTVSLTASAGYATEGLTHLVSSDNRTWSVGPTISLPIFDFGSNRATLNENKTQKLIDLADYQQTIQTAFEEVANALATRATIGEQLAAQRELVDARRGSYRRTRAQQGIGTASSLDVYEAQQSYYSAEQTMISKRLSRDTNLVTLYKVLGGGVLSDTARTSGNDDATRDSSS